MNIIEDLKEKVFDQSPDFLNALAVRRDSGERYQEAFLNLLAERIRRDLPEYNMIISVSFGKMIAPFSTKPEDILGIQRDKIRERICWPTWLGRDCKSKTCFSGEFSKGTEADALIIRSDGAFCFLEYENKRTELCDNFMKMYWLRQLLYRDFESLFVTTLTTRKEEGTFEGFKAYTTRIEPFLKRLLKDWKILEIVDLSSRNKRRINWEP